MKGTLVPVITMSSEVKTTIDELGKTGSDFGGIKATEVKIPKSIHQEKGEFEEFWQFPRGD